MRSYRETLEFDRRILLEEFELTDFARKVVGVGSVDNVRNNTLRRKAAVDRGRAEILAFLASAVKPVSPELSAELRAGHVRVAERRLDHDQLLRQRSGVVRGDRQFVPARRGRGARLHRCGRECLGRGRRRRLGYRTRRLLDRRDRGRPAACAGRDERGREGQADRAEWERPQLIHRRSTA